MDASQILIGADESGDLGETRSQHTSFHGCYTCPWRGRSQCPYRSVLISLGTATRNLRILRKFQLIKVFGRLAQRYFVSISNNKG